MGYSRNVGTRHMARSIWQPQLRGNLSAPLDFLRGGRAGIGLRVEDISDKPSV